MPVLANYLFFTGQCAEAMRAYERILGGKMEGLMTYADAPDPAQQCAEADKDRVMHCSLRIGERTLMASDAPPHMGAQAKSGFALSLTYDSPQEARRIFEALAEGGKVTMPMGKTFFAEAFGSLVDRFGTPWMVGGGMQSA